MTHLGTQPKNSPFVFHYSQGACMVVSKVGCGSNAEIPGVDVSMYFTVAKPGCAPLFIFSTYPMPTHRSQRRRQRTRQSVCFLKFISLNQKHIRQLQDILLWQVAEVLTSPVGKCFVILILFNQNLLE